MKRNLLLISNSTLYGRGYLDHCADEIKKLLDNKKTVLFIPYARPSGLTHKKYTKIAKDCINKMGFELKGINEYTDPKIAVEQADSIFIGGGNTFVLLKELYESGIMDLIKIRVERGMPYIGTSAGSNVACKSIMTTNDMPITYPPSFKALELVPFNINPHYLDPDPNSKHMGETRETRIREFHFFNQDYVVGLREGSMLLVKDDNITLKGSTGARVFKNNKEPLEIKPGEKLDFLLK
ncbi:MAG: dipeptidase PepE [Thermoplasmatales archaeon]|nr:MAG: dipeptidase PepE [Thermoplasmatales archaeon]